MKEGSHPQKLESKNNREDLCDAALQFHCRDEMDGTEGANGDVF